MPEADAIQTNFTAGEFSPRLFARSDLSKYANGLKELRNFIVQKHGGAIRRSGSRFVASVKFPNRFTRQLRFKFSSGQNYALEVGHQYFRFFRDRGRLQHSDVFSVTNATHVGTVCTLTIGPHGLQAGDVVSVQGVETDDAAYPIGYNGTFTITTADATTITYDNPNTPSGTYDTKGTVTETTGEVPTEILTPYTEDDLPLLKITQSADVLYITHPGHEPHQLRRGPGADSDPAIWTLLPLDAQDGPYFDVNGVELATFTIAAGLAGDTGVLASISGQAIATINDGQGFVPTDVGRIVRFKVPGDPNWGWCKITAVSNRQNIVVTLKTDTAGGAGVESWAMGAWSDTTGWPKCSVFHEDRLWFASTDAQPQHIFGSVIGDYDNFAADNAEGIAPEVQADSAIVIPVNDDLVNTIFWLKSDAKGLIALTDGGNFLAEATEENTITPTNLKVVRHIQESAAERPPPQQVAGVTLYVASANRKVREFVFRVEAEKFLAPDITVLSEHVTLHGLIDTGLQLEPDTLLWGVRGDGILACMTYEREEEVVAWGRHVMGGQLNGADQAAVESVCVIRDGEDDLVWMIVKRTINGATARYVEFIEALFPDTATVEEAFYVDAGLSLNDGKAITDIGTTFGVVTITAPGHGFADGNRVRLRSIRGATAGTGQDALEELNDTSFIIFGASADTFSLSDLDSNPIDGSDFADYVDGGFAYREVNQLPGLEHLAGETVKILADGATHPDKVVSAGGLVELDRFASIIHVGLGFTSRLETLPLILIGRGSSRGKLVRADHVVIRFNRSLGGRAGKAKMDPIVFRKALDAMGRQIALRSESARRSVAANHDIDATIIVETDEPLPMNVLGMVVEAGAEEV